MLRGPAKRAVRLLDTAEGHDVEGQTARMAQSVRGRPRSRGKLATCYQRGAQRVVGLPIAHHHREIYVFGGTRRLDAMCVAQNQVARGRAHQEELDAQRRGHRMQCTYHASESAKFNLCR